MRDDASKLLGTQGVEYVEHILAIRGTAFGELVGEVLHQLGVLLDHREDVLDADLVVLGDHHQLHVGKLHQLLAVSKDVLEVILVDHYWRGHVELD